MTTKFTCPRRAENGTDRADDPRKWCGPNLDHWSGGTCHYCGSISPEAFMAAASGGTEIGPTDRSYKAYVGTPPVEGKFYFQHLSDEQQNEFIDLLNTHAVNVGYPGYFYVLPFFMTRRPAAGS